MNNNIKTALIIGGIILGLFIILPLISGLFSGGQGYGMMGPGMMGGFGWGWFMPIFMILFWVLVIWAVVALVRGVAWPGNPDIGSGHIDSALEVLKKRYARGEMSKGEYEEKKRDLV